MADAFSQCNVAADTEVDASSLQCMSDVFQGMQHGNDAFQADLKSLLMVLFGALVFFMQAGFSMLCAGCVRKKNLLNTMLKNILDISGAAVSFYLVGFALAYGDGTFIGTNGFLSTNVDFAFWFLQFSFSATCVTIVAGTIAERCQMRAYLLYSVVVGSTVYPVVVHAVWSNTGFLSTAAENPLGGIGVIDFAGSGVIHVTGGTVALIAAWVLGPRRGRFHDAQGRLLSKPKTIEGHSTALQLLGTLILWFGWYGFNPGSALLLGVENYGVIAARAAANTTLAGALGALTALAFNVYLNFEGTGELNFNLSMAMNGSLSGLVAITSGCGTIELWASLAVGAVSGIIFVGGHYLLEKYRIDDVVDGIPIHLFNGVWGMIATGLFSSPRATEAAYGSDDHIGWFYSLGRQSADATLLGNQVLAVLFIMSWSVVVMLPFFLTLKKLDWYRLPETDEILGLDHSFHGAFLQEAETEVKAEIKDFHKLQRKLSRRSLDTTTQNHSKSTVPAGFEIYPGNHGASL